MKGTGAKRTVCPGSCMSTGATFPVAPVESAPMPAANDFSYRTCSMLRFHAKCVVNVLPNPPYIVQYLFN